MYSFKKTIVIAFVIAGASLSCVGAMEEIESEIQPLAELIPDTVRILLGTPADTATYSLGGGGPINFTFNSQESVYATLLIFSADPSSLATKNGLGDISATCVAGASNIAGHAWNNTSIDLTTVAGTTETYDCDPANTSEPLSKVVKVTFTVGFFPVGTYYWAILGYDEYYFLTSSSELRSFNVTP